ncbi:TIR domain-containing protein [Novosphingobium sp. FSW06-99]|uniref:TIR domain-containing protein n=1 Tax=Novosphingobium sp. FSW06-99 TaxID=1739113 RepID=UPI00082B12C9|nr:TIR domain-containing protein [Novosphingobium sp. FSW06-99]
MTMVPSGQRGRILFISYARADRERIDPLTRVLTEAGHQVWWDALIEGGEAFAKSIESALDLADVVIVAWSVHSVASDWVRDEASHGRDRGRLVPISLDGTLPPLGFRQYHFIDFSKWRGSAQAPEIAALVSAIAAGGTARATPSPDARARPSALRATLGRRALLFGTGSAVAALGGGYAAWRVLGAHGAPDGSIAVLPFANLSGDPEQSYFSDGLSEEMRAKLAEVGGFKVAAQISSDHFRNHEADARTIGDALGVAWLLDGSVRRAGDTLRITNELIEVRTGMTKWSQSYDRQMRDIFAVQSEIASTVIQAITGQIPAAAATLLKSGTAVVAAYDAFLRGRAYYNSDTGEDADRKALASFDAAIAADPNYAQAHAMRADTLLDIASEYAPADQLAALHADAMGSARRAVELAPRYAYGWLVLGEETLYSRHDFRAARPFYEKAHTLGPMDSEVLGQYAYFAARTGRLAEGIAAIERKIDLDRLNPLTYESKGLFLYCAKRFAEAARLFGQALAMSPGLSHAQSSLGFALLCQGELTAARAAFVAEPDERQRLTGLALVDRRLKAMPAARQSLDMLAHKFGDATLYLQAMVLAQWGETDRALDALEKARAANTPGLAWALVEPMLDPLRGQARFKRLLVGMGLL